MSDSAHTIVDFPSKTRDETKIAPDKIPPRPASATNDVMVEKYVRIRDHIKELEKKHVEELKKPRIALAILEHWLLDSLNKSETESARTKHGTAYKTVRTSCKVTDWIKTLAFIKKREAWDLLEARVSKTAAVAIVDEIKAPIPGVEITQENGVNVRRAAGTSAKPTPPEAA